MTAGHLMRGANIMRRTFPLNQVQGMKLVGPDEIIRLNDLNTNITLSYLSMRFALNKLKKKLHYSNYIVITKL